MSETRDQDPAAPFTDPLGSLRAALRNRYEIERQIGQGAFATVYLARDLKHERKVAIKVLNADPESETGEIRFIREIRLVARLQHPNILPLHDSGHVETQLYYVMPYVTGETLRMRMQRERQMGVTAACGIARETADALAYAHGQGIVHRDIKPENILLSGGHAIVADFGIARAIDVGGVRQLTMTGVGGPGTPAYMSPEQLLGDRPVDARSDIYSLGCVLYEMLAGKPPFPGKDGFVKRFTERPPHITSLRRGAAPWLDAVVAKALSRDPADRYATATELVSALCEPSLPTRTPTPNREHILRNALASPPLFESDPLQPRELAEGFPDPRRAPAVDSNQPLPEPAGRRQRLIRGVRAHPLRSAIPFVALLALALVPVSIKRDGSFLSLFGGGTRLDSTRIAVLASGAPAPGASAAGAGVADSLYDAFTRWDGSPVVPESRVAQAISDGASPPNTEAAALSLARRVGAGKAVWIHSSGTSEAPRVRVHLYDARSAETLDEFGVPPAPRGDAFYANAVQRLVGLSDRPPAATGCDDRTRSFRAWSACSRGHIALARWDVPAAKGGFLEAISADGNYVPAHLWLGQLLLWTSPESGEWRAHAVRASQNVSGLTSRDSSLAVAVGALASNDFPAACDTYSRLKDREPQSFVGWYGLGECRRLDKAVVPDRRTKSEWAFRSSLHTALRMYERAVALEPRAHSLLTYRKVQALLPTSPDKTFIGFAADSSTFAASPSIENDTLAFVPYPVAEFAALPASATRTHNAALERNSRLLLGFATEWARQFPRSPDAQEALADILETRGEVADVHSSGRPSALGAVLRAVSLTRNDQQRLRLAVREVRLRLKRQEFGRASAIADSLLVRHRAPQPEDAYELIGLAALTGRVGHTSVLARQGAWRVVATPVRIAPPLAAAGADLLAYAALGACGEQVSQLLRTVERQLQSYVAETHRAEVRRVLKNRALSMLVPCTGGQSALEIAAPQDRLYRMQRAFARGDVRTVRATFDTLSQMRRGSRPGDLTMDYTYQEAWLKAAIGDTAAAIDQLDLALGALPTLSAVSLQEPGAAAAVGRAMVLRTDLATGQRDFRTGRQWAAAVSALWSKADEPLQPTVARMRQLAAN